MTRRSLLSMLVAIIATVAAGFIGSTENAAAQQNLNICHYTVDIANIPACCFPIILQTEWLCTNGIRVETKIYNANGVYVEPLNPGGFPPCPPACRFNWASLNGIVNPTPLHGRTRYLINGCCYDLTALLDMAGGIVIVIRPCANGVC